MRKRIKSIIAFAMILCIALTACQSQEAREPKVETTMVRLYEVIPVPEDTEAHGQYQYQYPVVRAGLEYGISMSTEDKASFLTAIEALEGRSGLEIEYVIMGSWEELRQELQEARGDGATKLVLYDNSYDESLIKEAMNGGYVDFAPFMEEAGIYDSEDYQQAVLEAGQLGTQQLLVPVLYNVAGVTAEAKDYAAEPPTYDELLHMIEAARDSRTEASQMAVISKAMLDEIDPDLFWNAAGQHWADYKSQWEFFQLLHGYVTNYAAEGADEAALKRIWTIYIERLDDELQTGNGVGMGTVDRVYLSDDDLMAVNIDPDGYEYLWGNLYENTAYMVECTGAESDPYHSVVGLINTISGYYGGESVANEVWGYDYYSYFGYWPIQMYNAEGYAAQPFCYVAALDDGDEEAAFKVVQEIMKQPFSLQFGFSVYEPAWRDKLDAWINTANYLFERSGRYVRYAVGQKKWLEDAGSSLLSANHMDEARRIQIGEVLTNQLDNVQFAQIADAEVLAIWQETLSECASSGLSAEAGFELLCERMEAWHEEID